MISCKTAWSAMYGSIWLVWPWGVRLHSSCAFSCIGIRHWLRYALHFLVLQTSLRGGSYSFPSTPAGSGYQMVALSSWSSTCMGVCQLGLSRAYSSGKIACMNQIIQHGLRLNVWRLGLSTSMVWQCCCNAALRA